MLYLGQTSSLRDPPPQTQPRTVNVVLFGETGVGKSSVINLIARKEIAEVSSDVNGCTMQYKRYDIPFDNLDFAIFDTIGLEEPQMGVNGYLKAIEKAYELISRLGTAGGIHLLLFCMRGGRITATTQSNYRLFCECLCNTKVPIALVFTGLEREVEMEDWWRRNKKHIEDYGIKSDGHACITAVQDDAPGEDLKFAESQKRIRDLLKNCARKNEAFLPEAHPWFARFTKGMRGFITGKKSPKKKDIMKVLTHRCKLDAETAKKIAVMMESGDTETNKNKDPQAGNGEGEGEGGRVRDLAKNPTNDESPPNEHNNIEGVPDVDRNKGGDCVTNKKVAEAAPLNEPRKVEGAPDVARKQEREVTNQVAGDAPPSEPNNAKAAPDVRIKKNGGRRAAESGSDGDQVPEQTMPGGFTPAPGSRS